MTKAPAPQLVPDYGWLDPEPLTLAQIEAMIVDEPASTTIGPTRRPAPRRPRRTTPRALTRQSP